MTTLDDDLAVIGAHYQGRRRRLLIQLAAAMLAAGAALFRVANGGDHVWWIAAGLSALAAVGAYRQLEEARTAKNVAERHALLVAATHRPTDTHPRTETSR